MGNEIYVYLVDLPDHINEMVTPCADGYTIYIDPRQSNEGIRRSYEHALSHIRNNDFGKSDVQRIESAGHD